MSEFVRAVVGIFAAVAPFGALPVFRDARVTSDQRLPVVMLMFAAAFLLLGVAVLAGDPFLDWLDISPENFQLAASVIMLPQALHLLWRGRSLTDAGPGTVVPLAAPLLAGPASLAAAMSYGTRFGELDAIGATAVVLIATAVLLLASDWIGRKVSPAMIGLFGRLNGALLAVIAIELAVDGVRSI